MSKVLLALLLTFSSSFSQVSGSGWLWRNPLPQGNILFAMERYLNGNNLLQVGAHGTVLRSTDAGTTFSILNANTEDDIIEVVAVNASLLIALTIYFEQSALKSRVLRSSNNGDSWGTVLENVPALYSAVAYGPTNKVAVAGDQGIVRLSTDGGQSFNTILSQPAVDFRGTAYAGGILYAAVGNDGKVYKTTDNGQTWTMTPLSGNPILNSIYFISQLIGITCGYNGVAYKTTNGGSSWFNIDPATNKNLIQIRAASDSIYYALSDSNNIFKTTNGGGTWIKIEPGPGRFEYMTVYSATNIHILGDRQYLSTDGGATWQPFGSTTVTHENINNVITIQSGFNASNSRLDTFFVCGNNGFLAKTLNGGQNWQTLNSGTTLGLKSGFFVDNNTGWVVGGGPSSNVIIKTTNGGLNWFPQTSPITDSLRDVHFVSPTTGIIVGNASRVLRTTDAGNSWVVINAGLPGSYNVHSIDFIDANTGVFVCDFGFARRTTNAGLNWTSVTATASSMYGISFAGNTGIAVGQTGAILRSTNVGANWSILPSQQFNHLYSVFMANSTTGYACGNTGSVLKTTNGGLNWFSQNTGTYNILYGVSFADATTGFAVGERGTILKTTNGGILGIQQTSNELPGRFLLQQNYPNPFNPATRFGLHIPEFSHVSVRIYDVLGREVVTLIDGHQAPGKYEVDFDGSGFSSGVYFYRLEAVEASSLRSVTQTRKMVLIR